ncbi:hypothetical protein LUZ63_018350 [Rhynchospora breviuscula]|uniref:GH10 domain-containing protein n=1 Tax=Rhynchospora breviuscula TaxID=2022672 RepID=A0A9Q0C4D0_9POAL|nr:hypothetical protein LUZ63_018350 [Rhynchospora breviuscula]
MTAPWQKAAFFLFVLILGGQAIFVNSVPYDYSATTECLAEPLKPQYGGGIIVNPEFGKSLDGWTSFGYANVKQKVSKSGNKFSVAHDRSVPHHSVSQKVQLEKDKLYTLSAWLQVDKGTADVRAVVKTPNGFIAAGTIEAKASCWSMLKGGLTVNISGPAELYFESNNSTSEIWVDSVSLQPFTLDEWRSHHNNTINQVRKKMVSVTALDAKGKPLAGAKFTVYPIRPGFPFGTAINQAILWNPEYQKWFANRFTVTTFENEMKWYSTEYTQGHEDYSVADAMLAFARKNGVHVRGHNVFWDDPNTQMNWVKWLNNWQLQQAVTRRLNSVVSRYKNQVIAWDVNNENVHFNFFESRLGQDASTKFYQEVHRIDPNVVLFLNDYNTLEEPGDWNATPDKYLKRFHQIRAGVPNAKMAIGLESHFNVPNIPYMRSVLDQMASAGVPIWLTEVDVAGTDPNQAHYLEQILREGYSHPAVQGIVMWASWTPNGCYRMCLTNNQFQNFPVGNKVDSLIKEWNTNAHGTTAKDGSFQVHLAHGEYEVRFEHSSVNSSSVHKIKVDAGSHHEHKLQIQH